jgi:hypothetical protein
MAKELINNGKSVETLTHEEARRKNITTAEFQSGLDKDEQNQKITILMGVRFMLICGWLRQQQKGSA